MPSRAHIVSASLSRLCSASAESCGSTKRYNLDLLELVDAFYAARVASCCCFLTAEARRVGDIFQRQGVGLQNLVAVHVSNRHLGGGQQPEVVLVVAVHGVGELGQVAVGGRGLGGCDVGQVELFVAVLAGVSVEHPVYESALKAGALALEHEEAGACDFHRRAESL